LCTAAFYRDRSFLDAASASLSVDKNEFIAIRYQNLLIQNIIRFDRPRHGAIQEFQWLARKYRRSPASR
jgi:hypothetical protein